MYTSHRALGLSVVLVAALCATGAWAAPDRVTGVSASRASCSNASVSWNEAGTGDDGVAIKEYCVRGRSGRVAPVPGVGLQFGAWVGHGCGDDPDERSRTISGVIGPEGSTHFQVRAKDENGVRGPWSASSSSVSGC